mgnify:CR=1 FL=1
MVVANIFSISLLCSANSSIAFIQSTSVRYDFSSCVFMEGGKMKLCYSARSVNYKKSMHVFIHKAKISLVLSLSLYVAKKEAEVSSSARLFNFIQVKVRKRERERERYVIAVIG